ncbi:hypothetical protein OG500_24140 [Kitasatospora sp. NBC_01250]|uniref:hypothetical protein n=1 Tax=unclassified Kitasatospora TaxID=2633591 RepID=UPI002E15E2AF|nr:MULTISPECIES: hypothetical protein [unclassified Kitasatospora]WSJ69224.1 hypothetical protein OG294_25690 [Kitasatospora sp. NBC_01302]
MTAETSTAARPAKLIAAVALTAVEGAALTVWGGYMIVAGLVESTRNQGLVEYGGVVILLLGLLPLVAAGALLRLQRWGRSPAVLTHTTCLPVAYYMCQSGGSMAALGALVGLAGVAGLVMLLNPTVTAVLYRTED